MVIVKKYSSLLIPLMFVLIFFCLIMFSADSFAVAKEALNTWVSVLIPSLFVFLVLIDIIGKTGIIKFLGLLFEPIMKPLFNVSGIGAFPLIIGLTSGYPSGAKAIKDLYVNKKISLVEAERLLTFTNNCSPSFITSAVAVGLFNEPKLGIKLLVIHHLSVILVGICFRFYKYKSSKNIHTGQGWNLASWNKVKTELSNSSPITVKSIAPLLTDAIKNSALTMLLIGGFVILFRVFLNLLINLKIITFFTFGLKYLFLQIGFPLKLSAPITSGIVELTTGINMMANIAVPTEFKLIATCFLLSFGGISVIFQTAGVLVGTNISIKPYIFAKFLQAIIASVICIII